MNFTFHTALMFLYLHQKKDENNNHENPLYSLRIQINMLPDSGSIFGIDMYNVVFY